MLQNLAHQPVLRPALEASSAAVSQSHNKDRHDRVGICINICGRLASDIRTTIRPSDSINSLVPSSRKEGIKPIQLYTCCILLGKIPRLNCGRGAGRVLPPAVVLLRGSLIRSLGWSPGRAVSAALTFDAAPPSIGQILNSLSCLTRKRSSHHIRASCLFWLSVAAYLSTFSSWGWHWM